LNGTINNIQSSIQFTDEWNAFEDLKSRLSLLVTGLWTAKSFVGFRSQVGQIVERAIWSLGDQLNNRTCMEDGILKEAYIEAIKFLDLTQQAAIQLQNVTDSIEHELSAGKKVGNDTWWEDLKNEVGGVTNRLQDNRQKGFQEQMKNPDKKMATVISLDKEEDFEAKKTENIDSIKEREPPLTIMDSKSNIYVLSHPSGIKSLISHSEDPQLVIDIVLILLLALIFSVFFEWLGLPGFFGNMMAGVILGPSCLDKTRNIVQITSFGQVGALLLLLQLGREFSTRKLFKFANVTIIGTSSLCLLCSIFWGIFGTFVLGSGFCESCFIGLMISFTSTAVSIKCIKQSSTNPNIRRLFNESHIESIVNGVLLMQDALFSTLISILPVLARSSLSAPFTGLKQLLNFVLKAKVAAVLTGAFAYLCSSRLIAFMNGFGTKSASELTILLTALGSIWFCNHLNISGEFGAFFTGLSFAMFCNLENHDQKQSTLSIESAEEEGKHVGEGMIGILCDFFCTLFFASLGLFIDIQFAKEEIAVLLTAACIAIILKFAIMYMLCRGVCKIGSTPSSLVSLNLAQISEISMALGSKGRRLGIISREVYLLFVGSTLFCLILVPCLWKFVMLLLQNQLGQKDALVHELEVQQSQEI